jgi:hypothetical protein
MPFVFLLIAAVIIVVAFNNTAGALASELETDIPGYLPWAAAIAAVAGLGFVPGIRTPSRWLLALVLVALAVSNYQTILSGFASVAGSSTSAQSGGGNVSPATSYAANPNSPNITTAQVYGTGNVNASSQTASVTSPFGSYDPGAYLTAFETHAGFGGVA